jgi:hypothetical protein
MLDAPATLPYTQHPETRHRFGSTRRAYHKELTLLEHLAFFSGTLVIIAVAIVLGILVTEWAWLLLLLILPYMGMYISLIEKDRRMRLTRKALDSAANAEQPPPKRAPNGLRDLTETDRAGVGVEASLTQDRIGSDHHSTVQVH